MDTKNSPANPQNWVPSLTYPTPLPPPPPYYARGRLVPCFRSCILPAHVSARR